MRFRGNRSSPSHELRISVILLALVLQGCGTPRPVLYPNDQYQRVGKEQAERDIEACQRLADEQISSNAAEYVATSTVLGAGTGAASGAAGGAVTGEAGLGAAIGAAAGAASGFLRGVLGIQQPTRAYKRLVERCLKERGYEPTGWEEVQAATRMGDQPDVRSAGRLCRIVRLKTGSRNAISLKASIMWRPWAAAMSLALAYWRALNRATAG